MSFKKPNDSWQSDGTYVRVKRQWMYLHRAVDLERNTIGFHLSKTRDTKTAKHFFKRALRSFHILKLYILTLDKNPAYPIAIKELRNFRFFHRIRIFTQDYNPRYIFLYKYKVIIWFIW
ncbi:hypothetical protein COJ70_24295 [Priestia megaterium]|nr:hypothetical protein COJ70_24295 [Priestia megaterium]